VTNRVLSRLIAIVSLSALLAACTAFPGNSINQSRITENAKNINQNNKPTIRLASGEWVPYAGEKLPGYGCDSHVISEVFSQMGYSVEYGFFPWARALNLAETGEWDGTLEWAITPEFKEEFYINKEPISEQEWIFFYRKDRPFVWNTLDDLQGKVIGTTVSYVYSNVFREGIREGKLNIVEVSSDEANFRKLLAGRIDLFPMERNVGLALLKSRFTKEERDQITLDTKKLVTFEPRLLLTKTNPQNKQIMEMFDQKYESLRTSSGYMEIMKDCLQ
jgi:polar amino acid transport system substrate-binding protein